MSVVRCQWSVVSCQLLIVSCQWSVVSCQLLIVSCQWSVVNCQLSVVSCPLSVVNYLSSPLENGRTPGKSSPKTRGSNDIISFDFSLSHRFI
ncbi:MAG: hypothetical protein ACKPCK_06680 [Dolichospermum sp.]